MSLMVNNNIFSALCDIGLCDSGEVEVFHKGVRDREDIDVLRCGRTGALFLNRTDHMNISHYNEKPPTHRYGTKKRTLITSNEDTERRYSSHSNLVRGRSWLDIGAGSGAMLDVLGPLAASYAGVEPQTRAAEFLRDIGHEIYHDIDEIPVGDTYDVVTLFHVFEHLLSPVELLNSVHKIIKSDGVLLIEVPHARDMLITFMRNDAFCKHTFWSEHLFLHTRQTLAALVGHAGFDIVAVRGVQRYPVANHLYWLSRGAPGGHVQWGFLRDQILDQSYENLLGRLDMNDTLVLEARKRKE